MGRGPRSLDQWRAAFAWQAVHEARAVSDYAQAVTKLPALIQTVGLGQAVAFLSAGDAKQRKVYQHLQDWLCGGRLRERLRATGDGENPPPPPLASGPGSGPHVLLERLGAASGARYRAATREALALAVWLKRMADAVAQDGEGRPGGNS